MYALVGCCGWDYRDFHIKAGKRRELLLLKLPILYQVQPQWVVLSEYRLLSLHLKLILEASLHLLHNASIDDFKKLIARPTSRGFLAGCRSTSPASATAASLRSFHIARKARWLFISHLS